MRMQNRQEYPGSSHIIPLAHDRKVRHILWKRVPGKYVPVLLNEFCKNQVRKLKNPQDGCRNICHRKKRTQKDILRSKAQRIY